jgi:hypothetical protein
MSSSVSPRATAHTVAAFRAMSAHSSAAWTAMRCSYLLPNGSAMTIPSMMTLPRATLSFLHLHASESFSLAGLVSAVLHAILGKPAPSRVKPHQACRTSSKDTPLGTGKAH